MKLSHLYPLFLVAVALILVGVYVTQREDEAPYSQEPVAKTVPGSSDETLETETELATFTMTEVRAHATSEQCYTVVNGNVYDLTAWIAKHPGGSRAILSLCGTDGTATFEGQHGGQGRPESVLASYKIGTLAEN